MIKVVLRASVTSTYVDVMVQLLKFIRLVNMQNYPKAFKQSIELYKLSYYIHGCIEFSKIYILCTLSLVDSIVPASKSLHT